MAQSMNKGVKFTVGDYLVRKQIGAGSFSTVWRAQHRVHGTDVAIKEITTARLASKLQESLKSEIVILKKINHPNIIRLHDMIEESGKIYIILEYCRGGDLFFYLQNRQGRVPEETAKHFMQQLAIGLKVLRDNNLIHRDLKPQNLLLSTNDDKSTLKIADFGFARSLHTGGLAETLCGSPLYMAPEIMQLQKYDAKADLWSVGAILYQLVTGKTPYTGIHQIQLLQNIMKSTELQFPPDVKELSPHCKDLCRKLLRRNPVERLTFEEFFDHPFLSKREPGELLGNMKPQKFISGFPFSESSSVGKIEGIPQEVCLPFSFDDDSCGPEGSLSPMKKPPISTYGFSVDRKEVSDVPKNTDFRSKYGSIGQRLETTNFKLGVSNISGGKEKDPLKSVDIRQAKDSLEMIDQDYVIVRGPPVDMSSSASISNLCTELSKSGRLQQGFGGADLPSTAPMPIFVAAASKVERTESFESRSSAPGTSQGSADVIDTLEQPSADCMTRIRSLKYCASAVTELVNEKNMFQYFTCGLMTYHSGKALPPSLTISPIKLEAGKELEAFSIQLVILAIWKQALHICHTQAASAVEGSPNTRMREMTKEVGIARSESIKGIEPTGTQHLCSEVERAFLVAVGNAEDLAKVVEPGNSEMPDAMESIFQCALALGRRGAVDEYMGDIHNAVVYYSKAVSLFVFLLVEAPSLILNPSFTLTNSDRYRLRSYIDVLNNRQSISSSQRIALLKGKGP